MARSTHAVKIAVLETEMAALKGSVSDIHTKLDRVLAQQQKYKGFWGAVTLLVSGIWAAFTYFRGGN